MTRSRQKALSKPSLEKVTAAVSAATSAFGALSSATVSAWPTWISASDVKWGRQYFTTSVKVDGVYGTISNSSN